MRRSVYITMVIIFNSMTIAVFGQTACIYDVLEMGVINADHILITYSQFGVYGDSLEADFNNNGLVDIHDAIGVHAHVGSYCNIPIADIDTLTANVLVQIYETFETDAYDDIDTIPSGSVCYRLFVEAANNSNQVLSIYGDTTSAFSLSTNAGLFKHDLANQLLATDITSFVSIFPTSEYTSYFTCGAQTGEDSFSQFAIGMEWVDQAIAGTDFNENSLVGGGVLAFYGEPTPLLPGYHFIGQLTTLGSEEFMLTLNMDVRNLDEFPNFIRHVNLNFTEEGAQIFGCTDSSAQNFNPEATFDDSTCLSIADLDGSGDITTSDLLVLLEEFGCSFECGNSDISGDGIVNTTDLVIFLSYF